MAARLVSGRVKNPGVKLAPAGITMNELIKDYCGGMDEGHSFYGYLPGGASGGIYLSRHHGDEQRHGGQGRLGHKNSIFKM